MGATNFAKYAFLVPTLPILRRHGYSEKASETNLKRLTIKN